jgi:hypothetical protein
VDQAVEAGFVDAVAEWPSEPSSDDADPHRPMDSVGVLHHLGSSTS